MCGIAGKVSWISRPEEQLIKKITDEMYLRGPDASGFYFDQYAGLGHRRLSIIDLTESGRQPMKDITNRYKIVFNGEIYNFKELKTELLKLGAEFASNSDTEVILEGYKYWGAESLNKFNGMFAFAIWDTKDRELFLARDRLGKKPFYYYLLSDGGIVFASELKALLNDPEIKNILNLEAVNQYLSLGYILSDQSIIKNVNKLPPAHFLILNKNQPPVIRKYWALEEKFLEKRNISEHSAAEELSYLFDDAVKIRTIADVPLGAFLSGGIDSSSIVASMLRLSPSDKIKTYSIGFREKSYSELPEAQKAADFFNVSLHKEIVDCQMADVIEKLVKLADEPFADNSMIPTYYLSLFAKKEVTVALSGDGGDEMFAGYETYIADKLFQTFKYIPKIFLSLSSDIVSRLLPTTFNKVSLDFKIKRFLAGCNQNFTDAHYSWREIFSQDDKTGLITEKYKETLSSPLARDRFRYFANKLNSKDYLDQSMYVDINTWLLDDILVKADRMSMAASLELRAPFLDYRIAEFSASLPSDLRLKGFDKKYILKQSQKNRLPDKVINRKKRGFNSPVSHWLINGLEKSFEPLKKSENLLNELILPGSIDNLFKMHLAKKQDNSFKLFTLLNLGIWLSLNPNLNIKN